MEERVIWIFAIFAVRSFFSSFSDQKDIFEWEKGEKSIG